MDSAFIKMETVFRNFIPRQLLVIWGFPTLYYFGLLTDTTQTCQAVNSLREHRQLGFVMLNSNLAVSG